MTDRSPTIDAAASERARDAAIAQVDSAAKAAWKAEAKGCLITVASHRLYLMADDLWDIGLTRARENRAMGAIMRWGVKMHIVVPVGPAHTAQVQCHRGPRTQWMSLLFDGHDCNERGCSY